MARFSAARRKGETAFGRNPLESKSSGSSFTVSSRPRKRRGQRKGSLSSKGLSCWKRRSEAASRWRRPTSPGKASKAAGRSWRPFPAFGRCTSSRGRPPGGWPSPGRPQGVYAVCKIPESRFAIKPEGKYIGLWGLQDPGNVGTVIRTADALGMDGVVLSEGSCDLYSLKVLRAAMGSAFRLPVLAAPMEAFLRESGLTSFASVVDASAPSILDTRFPPGCILLIGNEGNGLSKEQVSKCARRVTIPMKGRAESFNAAMAATIFIWEMARGTGLNAKTSADVKVTQKRGQSEKFYSIFFKKSRESKEQSSLAGAHSPYFRSCPQLAPPDSEGCAAPKKALIIPFPPYSGGFPCRQSKVLPSTMTN